MTDDSDPIQSARAQPGGTSPHRSRVPRRRRQFFSHQFKRQSPQEIRSGPQKGPGRVNDDGFGPRKQGGQKIISEINLNWRQYHQLPLMFLQIQGRVASIDLAIPV